ncbi:hypothetical protein FRB90_007749, partial [Tulasnella sp. 427]
HPSRHRLRRSSTFDIDKPAMLFTEGLINDADGHDRYAPDTQAAARTTIKGSINDLLNPSPLAISVNLVAILRICSAVVSV